MTLKISSLLILIFILFNTSAFAATQIGQMVWVSGSVKAVSSDQKSRELQRRSPIFEQDTITTGASSGGQIVFTDNSVVALRSDTVFKVDHYQFHPDSPDNDAYVASVAKGGFRTITGLISKSKPDSYQVNTPVATIGVRGTEYDIFFSGKTGLRIKLSKGKLFVLNPAGKLELDASINRVYAAITNLTTPPKLSTTSFPEFKTQPAISNTGAGSSSFSPKSSNGFSAPKKVSGFCIN